MLRQTMVLVTGDFLCNFAMSNFWQNNIKIKSPMTKFKLPFVAITVMAGAVLTPALLNASDPVPTMDSKTTDLKKDNPQQPFRPKAPSHVSIHIVFNLYYNDDNRIGGTSKNPLGGNQENQAEAPKFFNLDIIYDFTH